MERVLKDFREMLIACLQRAVLIADNTTCLASPLLARRLMAFDAQSLLINQAAPLGESLLPRERRLPGAMFSCAPAPRQV